ncbi:hypothetical protein BJL96_27865 [Burkholderia cenocepacia]|nr:hypothetical protein [Burkholderia cenocepacia]
MNSIHLDMAVKVVSVVVNRHQPLMFVQIERLEHIATSIEYLFVRWSFVLRPTGQQVKYRVVDAGISHCLVVELSGRRTHGLQAIQAHRDAFLLAGAVRILGHILG